MDDQFLKVAKQAVIEAGKVIQGYSNKFGEKIHVSSKQDLKETAGVLGVGHRQKRQQKLDLYIAQAYPWDFAAGAVIVREAGGKVTGFDGKEPEWTKERLNIVASNGLIHDEILEALK